MLKFLKERENDYNANIFINELCEASKKLGILEANISNYHFDSILVPMLHKKEAISSMYIEGTQTTINDVLENEISAKSEEDIVMVEVKNHAYCLRYGADYLKSNAFTHNFVKELHQSMLNNVISKKLQHTLGKYKIQDNYIRNSLGSIVYTPPTYKETQKYMDELLNYMNCSDDGIHPLIKAAIIHSQFESIHPFDDGNGRVGRLLISLYLFKAKVINFPFFYISEAISQDKSVYYRKLTSTREGNYDEWIKYFLQKVIVQTDKHIKYIDVLNDIYEKTKNDLKSSIYTTKYEPIIECLFTTPILSSTYLANRINVSIGQAKRYLNVMEEKGILLGDDRQRNKRYYFMELLDLLRNF